MDPIEVTASALDLTREQLAQAFVDHVENAVETENLFYTGPEARDDGDLRGSTYTRIRHPLDKDVPPHSFVVQLSNVCDANTKHMRAPHVYARVTVELIDETTP